MTQKDELLKDIFARIAQTSEESEDSHINMPSKSFSVQNILNQHGEIEIDLLIHFFEEKKIIVDRFFQDKNNVEKILFPFFDFLKYTFFSDNKIVPQHIIDILQKFPSVRDAVILYIQQKNKDITSSQHVEQYDTISFHLFLL